MHACRMGKYHVTRANESGMTRFTSWNSHRYRTMNKRARRGKGKLHVHGEPCLCCALDRPYSLMSLDEILEMPINDRLSYSLQVYAAAYDIGMREHTGDPNGLEARELLSSCARAIARWLQNDKELQAELEKIGAISKVRESEDDS